MHTTIYLDVDGVLNAVSKKTPALSLTGWENWQTKPVNGWPILYSPDMIDALNELADRDDVTFKWLTTWTDDAAQVLSPAIGIHGETWGVLHGDQHAWGGKQGWWKLEAIRADVATSSRGGKRFIWIDDDLSAEREACDWLRARADVLGVSPSISRGLTRGDVESIRAFIAGGVKAPTA